MFILRFVQILMISANLKLPVFAISPFSYEESQVLKALELGSALRRLSLHLSLQAVETAECLPYGIKLLKYM